MILFSFCSGPRPLTLGENIPYADESPERPLIQQRAKPPRTFMATNNSFSAIAETSPVLVTVTQHHHHHQPLSLPKSDESKTELSSSDDTDTSTTSSPREKISSTIRIEQLREMSRMLSNLEKKAHHLERKFSLNRSLSLNYKNHKNYECCCRANNYYYNNNNSVRSRLSLTKDEKTDKNISRRRQLHDSNSNSNISNHGIHGGSGNGVGSGGINGSGGVGTGHKSHHRRHGAKDRSIRRRHTVGGAHDYHSKNEHIINDCDRFIVDPLNVSDDDSGGEIEQRQLAPGN